MDCLVERVFDYIPCDTGPSLPELRSNVPAIPSETLSGRSQTGTQLVVLMLSAALSCAPPPEEVAQVDCGEGTTLVDLTCVVEEQTPLLQREPVHVRLPFVEGTNVFVSQGNRGGFSHTAEQIHAVDFEVDEGTVVVAMREGMVTQLKEDSTSGCGDPSCADDANFIVIDHGDGTFAGYFHLMVDGATVELFDVVGAGQPIGLSGNTGFSTGPHLHAQVADVFFDTIPMLFDECGEAPCVGQFSFTSENAQNDPPTGFIPSTCSPDIFAHAGILLEEGAPCAVVDVDVPYQIAGEALPDDAAAVAFSFFIGFGEFTTFCTELDEEGRFDFDVTFPDSLLPLGFSTFSIVPSPSADCATYPASETVPVILRAP